MRIFIFLLCLLLFIPAVSDGQTCSVFSETFGGTTRTWYSNNAASWSLSTVLTGTSTNDQWTYAEAVFPASSNFMIDTDVSSSGTGSYSIYLLNLSGQTVSMAGGSLLDGFAVWVTPTGSVSLMGWDINDFKWVTYGSVSPGQITSIGLKFTSNAVYGRVNGNDVIGPVTADLATYKPDTLWLQVQGQNVSATFDNICADPATASPPPPTGLAVPHLTYSIANNMITLSWTAVSGATGYTIDAWQLPSAYYVNDLYVGKITSVGPLSLSAIPPGVYNVSVMAHGKTSSSPPSNVITVPVGTAMGPYAPHNLRYTLNGKNLTILWNPSVKATGYKIGVGQQTGMYSQVYNIGNIQSIGPIDVTPYPPGTYYVAVKAYDQTGESPFSDEIGIKNVAGTLTINPTNVTGGATGQYTSGTNGTKVDFTVTPNVADGSVTASMSSGQKVLSIRTDSASAAITWNGVKIDGLGHLTADERKALNNLVTSDLAEAIAMIPLDASCGNVELDLASAQALLLPWQIILKYKSCNPGADARAMAEKSACSYYGTIDTAKSPKHILLSEHDPIPYVFGSAPVDNTGALINNKNQCPDILSAVDFSALFSPSMKQQALVESFTTACGSKCRAACGPDCEPRNCTKKMVYECDVTQTHLQEWEKHEQCGVHQGCIDHDNCYDDCDSSYQCEDSWSNWSCHRKCDGECLATYCKKCAVYGVLGGFWSGAGCLATNCECPRWALGFGPFTEYRDFLYLKNPQYGACKIQKCNEASQAGNDIPDTQVIELGQKFGSFTFSYETYSIKDRIIVTYESGVLFDTGCVGANGTKTLQFSGSTTYITVTVIPNCAGETGTAWNYKVTCPK